MMMILYKLTPDKGCVGEADKKNSKQLLKNVKAFVSQT